MVLSGEEEKEDEDEDEKEKEEEEPFLNEELNEKALQEVMQ